MGLPAGYVLRPPTAVDLDAVAAVLVADELAVVGQVVLGIDYLRGQWSRPDLDLATDSRVVVDGRESIVGYGQATLGEGNLVTSWGVVHPDRRRLGVGSAVLDWTIDRAAELAIGDPTTTFRHVIWADDRAAAAMLQARGLQPVYHFWHMQIDGLEPIDPGPLPDGIEIGGLEPPGDLAAVHAILVDAFADDLSHHPDPLEAWVAAETGSPRYDPTLWLVARDGGEAVGALTASVGGDRGWVDYLGVRAPYRGRGIGAALLRRSFAMLAERGLERALVSVDARNPTGATALYERVGMRVVARWDAWERSMGGSL